MKEIILIAEDLSEEQEKAKAVVFESGAQPIIGGTLDDVLRLWDKLGDKITGILTDLHFPESAGRDENPCGLAVVIKAAQEGIPVSICSSIDHHHTRYLKTIVEGLRKLSGQSIPFTMDRKDWNLALAELKMIQKEKEVG